jgi:flagellar export protein FliJ
MNGMKNLSTLVRLHKWRIDEATRNLAGLETLAAGFRNDIEQIDIGLGTEARLAGDSVESAVSYSNFMRAEMTRRANLEQSLAELDGEIAEARENLAAAYRRLKSFEITLDRKRQQAARLSDRRQQTALDEIGQQRHRAQSAENFG